MGAIRKQGRSSGEGKGELIEIHQHSAEDLEGHL